LSTYPGASTELTPVLKPITFGTDFVVIPLARSASEKIYAALGETVPKKVLHVQIEKNGVIQFGAYDYFHPTVRVINAYSCGILQSEFREISLTQL
jgi:hypothetical protein